MKAYANIDEYIETSPEYLHELLQTMRQTIRETAPEAKEIISYGIPTFSLNGNLVHFGGFKDHIGFFPGAGAVEAFKEELSQYETSKGTIRLPLDKPLPLPLIRKIVNFRVQQNRDKQKK